MNQAIGPKVHAGLCPDDRDALLQLLGYLHGPLMVDALVRYFKNPPPLSPALEGLDSQALRELQGMLRLRALLLSMVLPARGPALEKLTRLGAGFGKAPTRDYSHDLRPAANGFALPDREGPAGGWVSAFLRERMAELSPPGPPDILPLTLPALHRPPGASAMGSAALCG